MDPLSFFLKSNTRDPFNPTAQQKIWKQICGPTHFRATTGILIPPEAMEWPPRLLAAGAELWICRGCGEGQLVGSLAPASLDPSSEQEVLGRFEGTSSCFAQPSRKLQGIGRCQGPTFTSFSSLMASGKSIPVTLPSWLERGDKKTPMSLTYLANAVLLILMRKHTIALTAETVWILRGREKGVKQKTAISFLHILNLVTKSAISRESLKWAKEGQPESSAALSLDH